MDLASHSSTEPAVDQLADIRPQCEAQTCAHDATHGLVFTGRCRCNPSRTGVWLLCLPHVETGLQVLRDPSTVGVTWLCTRCDLTGFQCAPVRIDSLR